MKNFILVMLMVSGLNALASMDASEVETTQPTQQEISRNRACFQELRDNGCGEPTDDPQNYRICINNAFDSLSSDCKAMMSRLYGKRK